jgi:hypothetical protein
MRGANVISTKFERLAAGTTSPAVVGNHIAIGSFTDKLRLNRDDSLAYQLSHIVDDRGQYATMLTVLDTRCGEVIDDATIIYGKSFGGLITGPDAHQAYLLTVTSEEPSVGPYSTTVTVIRYRHGTALTRSRRS